MVYYDVVNLIRVSQSIDKTILAQSDLKIVKFREFILLIGRALQGRI